MRDEDKIEAEIQAKGLNAPRLTPALIDATIVSEHYFTAAHGRNGAIADNAYVGRERPLADNGDLHPLDLLTFCVLVLKNGFVVTGESACASPANFNADLGRKIARDNARNKIWAFEGYALRERLSA